MHLFLLVGSAAIFAFLCRTLIILIVALEVILVFLVFVVIVAVVLVLLIFVVVVVVVLVLLVVAAVVIFHVVLVLLVVVVIIIIFILILVVIVVLAVTIVLPRRLRVFIIVPVFLPSAFFINTPKIIANLLLFSYCKVFVLIAADVAGELHRIINEKGMLLEFLLRGQRH